ncbi:MAG: pyrrolidone-carboxylate peptidase [Myxococcales bacterium]|nr:pyrrolidone-carboxylate peptidase [Myxococcales bacterium]
MRSQDCSLTGYTLPAVLALIAVAATAIFYGGCAVTPEPPTDPNAGLFRDFLDGKFDGAGHPLNAVVTHASAICGNTSIAAACIGALAGGEQTGDLVASTRVRVHAHTGDVLTIEILDQDTVIAHDTLTSSRVRHLDSWFDLPVSWSSDGKPVRVRLTPAPGAQLEVDYIEVFPKRFGLVLSPGSGAIADTDHITFELPRNHKVDRITANGVDITARLQALLASGHATKTTTAYRTLIDVGVGDLLEARAAVTELELRAGEAARMQLLQVTPACHYEGDPNGKKVIVTGFQPFPADASHENVSGVAVTALDPAALHGAQVMRLVMPVEYDRAAAEVTDAIMRCAPDIVISFGQGGGAIALEEVAYNLQDTGEVAGGVPDNRGVIRAAMPIDATAAATRDTLLPIDAIEHALVAIGEAPEHSRDPGRYICNNVMFADIGAMTGRHAGFIHLPYTSQFDEAVRARFAKVVQTAIQAAVDAP